MNITAYGAMKAIIEINETIEELKNRNNGNQPDLTICKTTGYLADYRSVLMDAMQKTEIKF